MAGIDVHKKMLAVVVADVHVEGEYQFERRHFGSTPEQLQLLAEWLLEQMVEEAVMESTAQYWKPVWGVLEAEVPEAGRCRPSFGNVASGTGAI
jgi:transposase